MISATVIGSCVVSPPCSWESLLGEGSFSLNDLSPLLSHYSGHQSYSNLYVALLSSLWCSSCDVVCFLINWSVSVTYVSFIMRFCMMDVNVTGFYPWSGMMSFCVWMICTVAYVECHGEVDGCNSCMWSSSGVSYSCDIGDYPYVVIWNGLCRNPGNWSCGVCENMTETLNSFTCLFPHSNVWNLTWHVDFCAV